MKRCLLLDLSQCLHEFSLPESGYHAASHVLACCAQFQTYWNGAKTNLSLLLKYREARCATVKGSSLHSVLTFGTSFTMETPAASEELDRYQAVLQDRLRVSNSEGSNWFDPAVEELRMAPLVWWGVKQHFEPYQHVNRGYGVLGHIPDDSSSPESARSDQNSTNRNPILLNTDSPWSAFLCGSQGSGKSHSLSCMLENCLLTDATILPQIGPNPHPLAGLVFHYDRCQGSGVCEAAYLCTNIPTTVLVSPSNYGRLKAAYEAMAESQGGTITVKQLYILPKYLDTERMKTLMAVGKDDDMPLYMQVSFPTHVLARSSHQCRQSS